MKFTHYFPFALLLIGCSNSNDNKNTPNETSPANSVKEQTAAGEAKSEKSASIKILKEGKLVKEYNPLTPGASKMSDASGKESLMINLNSPDNSYSLLGSLKNAVSGSYDFGEAGVADAQIEMYSNSTVLPARLILDKGGLKITFSDKTCSGSFTGTKTGTDGKKYELSGIFTNIPLVKQGSGETY